MGYGHPRDYDYYIKRSHSGDPFLSGSLGRSAVGVIKLATKSTSIAAHEIGHSLYYASEDSTDPFRPANTLKHANLWIANNGQIIGPGSSKEYGGKFSIMGKTSINLDFGLPHKINMEWIKSNEYHSINQNGTYRIYAHDRGIKQSGRKYGIKINELVSPLTINTTISQHYFIEYKSNTGYVDTNNGVIMTVFDGNNYTPVLCWIIPLALALVPKTLL